MTGGKLSQETVKRLPAPTKGNRVTYFAGAVIQGAKAPRGFGVRVTAVNAGVKLHQPAGVKMHHGSILACRRWAFTARTADLLGGAERSSPEAA